MNVRLADHFSELVRVARVKGLNREDAEEVAQDALMVFAEKARSQEIRILTEESILNRAGRKRTVRGWLTDVVGLLLRNKIRDVRRRNPASETLDGLSLACPRATSEDRVYLLDFARDAFAVLDDDEAELLRLDLLGLNSSEIGSELGLPDSTVRVRKMRLLERLRCHPSLRKYQEDAPGTRERNHGKRKRNDDDDLPPSPGGGNLREHDMKHHSPNKNEPLFAAAERRRVESLLHDYGQMCREAGWDPMEAAGRTTHRRRSSSPWTKPTQWLGPLALSLCAVGMLVVSLDESKHMKAAEQEMDRMDAAPRASAAIVTGHREHVQVSLVPDLPPMIEVSTPFPRIGPGGGGILFSDSWVSSLS